MPSANLYGRSIAFFSRSLLFPRSVELARTTRSIAATPINPSESCMNKGLEERERLP